METVDGEEVAKVYYLSGDRTSVTSEVLAGLPGFSENYCSRHFLRMVVALQAVASDAEPSEVTFEGL